MTMDVVFSPENKKRKSSCASLSPETFDVGRVKRCRSGGYAAAEGLMENRASLYEQKVELTKLKYV